MSAVAIDWSGIRAAAVVIGIRAAARQSAANLPPIEQNRFVKRVLKRAEREHWTAKANSLAPIPAQAKPLSSIVVNGSVALSNVLERLGDSSRVHLAKAGNKASKHFAKLTGGKVAQQSGDFKNVAQALAPIHGWTEKGGAAANVMVNVALLGVNPGEVQVDGQVIDCE